MHGERADTHMVVMAVRICVSIVVDGGTTVVLVSVTVYVVCVYVSVVAATVAAAAWGRSAWSSQLSRFFLLLFSLALPTTLPFLRPSWEGSREAWRQRRGRRTHSWGSGSRPSASASCTGCA